MILPTTTRLLSRQTRLLPLLHPLRHVSAFPATRLPAPQSRNFLKFLRRGPAVPVDSKMAYPERLLVYYAGKRTVYLGTLKLYTVLLFSYCGLIIAPSLVGSDNSTIVKDLGLGDIELPEWVLPVGVILGSLAPLVLMQWLTPPYVTHAYIHLPPWARYSKPQLLQFLKQLPKDAPVDLATIRWFGRPKVTRARLGELKMVNERLGCVNTVVQVGRGTAPLHKFYVDWRKSPAVVKEPEAIGQIGKMVIKWQEDGIKTTETLKKQKKIAETWGKGAM